ncbi:MAG: ABC transporter permease [Blastocatellia bacterium]
MVASHMNDLQEISTPSFRALPGLSRVGVIAVNTFRESVRDRVLYNLALFVLILVGGSIFISELSVSQEAKFIATLGLSSMLIFGALIAIFIGVGLVYKEIDRRTIYNLLSKPVHRHEFIIGKYFGLCLTLLVNSLVMLLAIELALLYVNRGFTPVQWPVLAAGLLIYLELTVLVAIALLFSSFSTPMLAALFTFALYVIGHFSADLKLTASLSQSFVVRALLSAAYYLLPNLRIFNFITAASHGDLVDVARAIWALAYAVIYVGILLSATVLIFQRRNFK